MTGGNVTRLIAAYGLGPRGEAIRIKWSDGQVDLVPLKAGSFLLARPATQSVTCRVVGCRWPRAGT